MPMSVVGGETLTKTALHLRPCSRSVTQRPEAEAYSPGVTAGAWPTRVTSSRSPLTCNRRTQKPDWVLLKGDPLHQTVEMLEFLSGGELSGRQRGAHDGGRTGGYVDGLEHLQIDALVKADRTAAITGIDAEYIAGDLMSQKPVFPNSVMQPVRG